MNIENTQAETLLGRFPDIEISVDALDSLNLDNQEEETIEDDKEDSGDGSFLPTLDDENADDSQEGDDVEYEGGTPEAIAIFQVMKEKGIVAEDAEFNGTWEDIDDLVSNYLPQRAAEAIIEQAPPKFRTLLAAVYNDGKEPTIDELKTIILAAENDLVETKFEVKTDDDAREFLEKVYEQKGMRKSAIKAQLDDIEDEDKLLEEAKKEYETMNAGKEKQLEKIRQEQQAKREADMQAQKEFINSVKQELTEATWKPERKQVVAKTISNIPNIFSKVEKSPKAIVQLADFVSYFDEKTGMFNMDAYKKQALSPNIRKEAKSVVQSAINRITKSTGKMKPSEELDNLVPIFD